MSDRPTVYVVDDDASIRRTLPAAIASPFYRVVAFAAAEAFLANYDGRGPGCLIADLRMPQMTGLELQEELHRRQWTLPIIFLTGFGTVDTATRAMKAGAIYFFEKSTDPKVLIARIEEAIRLDAQGRQLREAQSSVAQRINQLTRRQRHILDLVIQGRTSKQIAEELGRSIKTVEVHRSQILRRMNAQGVAELMHMVLSTGGQANPASADLSKPMMAIGA
jgi:FixJ family two-component response regulator